MTIRSGLGSAYYVDGNILSNDTSAIGNITTSLKPIASTGIDKFGNERLPGDRDGTMKWTTFFNTSAGQAHPTLRTLPTTNRIVTYVIGSSIGDPAANLQAKQINYNLKRATAGDLTLDVETMGDGLGLNWGISLTPGVRTDSVATNGASADNLAATTFGAVAYLHLITYDNAATFDIQDSADNATFTTVAGLGFLPVATGASMLKTAANATIRRYTRIVSSGNTGPSSFVATFARGEANPVY